MKYLPISKELEPLINNLDPIKTTILFRSLMRSAESREDAKLISQANGLVSIVASLEIKTGGIL